MSGNKKGWNEKETLCWGCQNYSRCSWSRGKPVKGWTATPTEFIDRWGDETRIVHSFLVEKCPQFTADRKKPVYVKKIGAIIGKSEAATLKLFERRGIGYVGDLLKEKGYKLHVCKGDKQNQYFIEEIKRTVAAADDAKAERLTGL